MTKPVVHEPYAVRALTLRQPYASAVAVLGKDIENRGWYWLMGSSAVIRGV